MSTAITTTTTRTAEEQLHWDAIMDVLSGRASSLLAAKAVRQSVNFARAKRLGLADILAFNFAQDPTILFMMENMNSGTRWGDLEHDYLRSRLTSVNAEIEAIRRSGKSGRWRDAIALYKEQADLKAKIGLPV